MHPPTPLIILAGAGTGKTATIVGRMSNMINKNNIDPYNILALTFTNESALNMKIRLSQEIGPDGMNIASSTFHAFALDITLEYFSILGYTSKPKLMNISDIYFLLRSNFNLLKNFRSKNFKRDPILAINCLYKVFDGFRQNLLSNNELNILKDKELLYINEIESLDLAEIKNQLIDAVNIYPQYQKLKLDKNWIDYGDIINNLWYLINNDDKILKSLQDKYHHIFIDEFQDNNYALTKIIEKIALPQNSITVVGDDDQCIYAFRQANIQNIHQFIDQFSNKKLSLVNLMENYRSNQSILHLANDVISKNQNRLDKDKLYSQIYSSTKPKLYIGSVNDQLIQLGNNIISLIGNNTSQNDIVILLRTHSKCKLVSEYLKSLGLNTYYFDKKLYEQSIIKDFISYLNIIAKSEISDYAFIRLLNKHYSTKEVNALLNKYKSNETNLSIIDYFRKYKLLSDTYLINIIELLQRVKWNDIENLLWKILNISNLYKKKYSYNNILKKIESQSIKQFINIVSEYSIRHKVNNLNDLLDFINIQSQINDIFVDQLVDIDKINAIKIFTIHSAKGMEFKHVYIPFLSSGSFPINYSKMKNINRLPVSWKRWDTEGNDEKQLHYEEERRLFYVAITRAKDTLTLYTTERRQSKFIKNIDSSLIKKEIIMHNEKEKSDLESLIGKFNAKLLAEMSMGHFEAAHSIVNAIKNINNMQNKIKPKWDMNCPYQQEIYNFYHKKEYKFKAPNIKLSATSISTYLECPLKYKYKYIDSLPKAPESIQLKLGKIIHKVLEDFHANDKYCNFDDLKLLLDNNWKNLNSIYNQQKDQFYEDGIDMIKNYWEYLINNPTTNIFTEYDFKFNFDNTIINGKCDLIDINSSNVLSIIDYKTSKTKKSITEIKKDIQIGIYALFMYYEGISKNNINIKKLPDKLIMLFLRDPNPQVAFKFELEDLEYFKNKINYTTQGITDNKFTGIKGRHCDWCDYKDLICPLFDK